MSHKRLTINDLTMQHRIILASFVFVPLSLKTRGRQTRDIVKTCLPVFRQSFKARSSRNWTLGVSSCCRVLVRLGLLQVIGTIRRTWSPPRGEMQEYDSPIYGLTESGFTYVLGTMDHNHLCSAKRAFDGYANYPYVNDAKAIESFTKFSGLSILKRHEDYDEEYSGD